MRYIDVALVITEVATTTNPSDTVVLTANMKITQKCLQEKSTNQRSCLVHSCTERRALSW
jgi:hypothetical protein